VFHISCLFHILYFNKVLTKQEFQRYSRHIIIPEIGIIGQEKIKNSKVLVIGAGGLGCPVGQYLAAAGVGTIGIVDFDEVDESNLQRQILFTPEDIGKSKAEVAAQKLKKQNPNLQFTIYNLQFTSANSLDIIKNYDIIVDGSDNFPTRYLVNDSCVILGKPLVSGSVFKFQGQVSVFNYKNGPTYRCLFPEPPNSDDVPNCTEIGVLGVLSGIIGTIMANETLKIILEIGKVLSGKLLVMDTLSLTMQTLSFRRNPKNLNIKNLIDYQVFCSSNDKDFIESNLINSSNKYRES